MASQFGQAARDRKSSLGRQMRLETSVNIQIPKISDIWTGQILAKRPSLG
jgi:hypothetical protein